MDCQERASVGGNISVAISSAKLAKHIWVNHHELCKTTHSSGESLLRHQGNEIWGEKSWKTPSCNSPWVRGACPSPHHSQTPFGGQQRWDTSIHIMPVDRLHQDDVRPFFHRQGRSWPQERAKLGACCFLSTYLYLLNTKDNTCNHVAQ